MRIATNSYSDSMLNQFNTLAAQQYKLQNQVSTGLRVQSAADDPTAMQNTLSDLEQQATQNQYSANISTLQTRSTTVDNVLQSLQTIVSRAGEIATAGGNATASQSSLSTYGDEVNTLINEVVTAANTKDPSTGKYLFGGTASGTPPFTTTTDANNNVTAVTYNGNNNTNQTQIGAGLTASADIPGANSGSTGARGLITDSQSGADLLNHLIQLRDDLNSGNTTAITATDSSNIQKDENNIAYQVANNGVTQNQLTNAASFATSNNSNLTQIISNASSADLMNTMVELNQAQTAYQAALQTSAKIMQTSLVNYIN
jgi:flagellar hook-associated protein 3 FlgL